MTISYQADDRVVATSKGLTVTFGKDVAINEYIIPGAGEYDVAGVQCEVYSLGTSLAYFARIEDLVVTFLHDTNHGVSELDDASSTNILIMDIRSDVKPEDVKPILKRLEPSYVFLIG